MSKRLLSLALIAMVVCFVSAAYAEVQNVKVGGDLTVVGASRDNITLRGESAENPGGQGASGLASIARVKIDANLTDNVDVTFRLLNERVWSTSETAAPNGTGIDIDLAYVTFKDFLKDTIGVPLTLKIGRQEIKLGSGLLIGDPDTNRLAAGNLAGTVLADLSARKAFDGAVAVMDFNPLTITGAAVKVTETSALISEDDVNAYALNAAYNTGVMNTVAELTYVLETRNKENAGGANLGNWGDINNYGARITSMPIDNLGLEAEYVYQTSRDASVRADRESVTASAFRLGGNYTLANVAMTPSFGLDYTRLTKNWNPMFEDLTPADIMNLIFSNSNVQLFGATVGIKATDDISMKLRYAYARLMDTVGAVLPGNGLGAGVNYSLDGTKKMLGQELDLDLKYDYTSDVQFGLNMGYFKPGKAFAPVSRNGASQVIGSMKVSF